MSAPASPLEVSRTLFVCCCILGLKPVGARLKPAEVSWKVRWYNALARTVDLGSSRSLGEITRCPRLAEAHRQSSTVGISPTWDANLSSLVGATRAPESASIVFSYCRPLHVSDNWWPGLSYGCPCLFEDRVRPVTSYCCHFVLVFAGNYCLKEVG